MNIRRLFAPGRSGEAVNIAPAAEVPQGPQVAYHPDLVPSLELMRSEGIEVIEDWFKWGEEWSMLLRVYGPLGGTSRVLEIGCGLGRIAFSLRYILSPGGTYNGFEIVREKVSFLEQRFEPAYPNFRFTWADVHNSYYNPAGASRAWEYRFPYEDGRFDVVFAASVFTHTLPDVARHYFLESARVLRPGGRCVFSFFLLNNYDPARPRPFPFGHSRFNLDHAFGEWANDFAIANPDNPEQMTGFRMSLLEKFAATAGLRLIEAVPSLWCGRFSNWISTQDVLVFEKQGIR